MFLSQSRLHDPSEFALRILRRLALAKERSQAKTAAAYIRGAGSSKTGKRGIQKMREWQTKYRINFPLARQNRLRSDACGQPRSGHGVPQLSETPSGISLWGAPAHASARTATGYCATTASTSASGAYAENHAVTKSS